MGTASDSFTSRSNSPRSKKQRYFSKASSPMRDSGNNTKKRPFHSSMSSISRPASRASRTTDYESTVNKPNSRDAYSDTLHSSAKSSTDPENWSCKTADRSRGDIENSPLPVKRTSCSVKRHSSHRSTGSEGSGRKIRARQSPSSSSHVNRPSDASKNRFSRDPDSSTRNIGSEPDHNSRKGRPSVRGGDVYSRNNRSTSPSQEQSFIDSAFGAGAALLRFVMPRAKRLSNVPRDPSDRVISSSAPKEIPPWMQEGPPLRRVPTPPGVRPLDNLSIHSVNSSLAGHTYEMMNFHSLTELPRVSASLLISSANSIPTDQKTTDSVNESDPGAGAICISHPSSRKTSMRRKKAKSKSKGTLTDENLHELSVALKSHSLNSDSTEKEVGSKELVEVRRNCIYYESNEDVGIQDSVYSIPCPSPADSPCPTPPLRITSLYAEYCASPKNCSDLSLLPVSFESLNKLQCIVDCKKKSEVSSGSDMCTPGMVFASTSSQLCKCHAAPLSASAAPVDNSALVVVQPSHENEEKNRVTIALPSINFASVRHPDEERRKLMKLGPQKGWSFPVHSQFGKISSSGLKSPGIVFDRTNSILQKANSDNFLSERLAVFRQQQVCRTFDRSQLPMDPVEDFKRFRPNVSPLTASPLLQTETQDGDHATDVAAALAVEGNVASCCCCCRGYYMSAEARGIEGEIRRLREAGHHRLGSPCSASRRRHHRLHAINTIEKTIQRLHHLPPAELCHRPTSQGPLSQSEVYVSSDRAFTNRRGSLRKRDKTGRLTASDGYPSFGGNYDSSNLPDSRYSDASTTSGDLTSSTCSVLENKSSVSTFHPLPVNNSRRSPFKSPDYISTHANYLHHLNQSGRISHPDNKPIYSSKSASSCGTATGTWYERVPNRLSRPQLQPLYQQNNRQPNISCYAASDRGAMDVANANTMMDGGLSTADEVSDIPSSSSTLAEGQRNSSMEPDSLDSGVDHKVNTTFRNGDESHTYDNANGGHCAANGHQEDGNYVNEDGVPRLPSAIEAVLRGVWPFEKALWHSSPATVGLSHTNGAQVDPPGIMATSSVTSRRAQSQQQLLSNKVEMVYGLLSMFSSGDRAEMSKTLLAMSSSPDSCLALRQSGCLPLLIQLLHGGGGDGGDVPSRETRLRASQALQNVVHANADEKRGRREARVLRLLEQIRAYSDYLYERLERTSAGQGPLLEDDMDRHPCPAMAAVMKLSFDEEHRLAMCTLGGLHAIAELVTRDHEAHGATTPDNFCITLRRYAGMALTNLTFGAGTNKALVCSFSAFLRALVAQLSSPSQDLRQVTSSVIRNLSWRADSSSKQALREAGAVAGLMRAALTASKEATLKVILSAVWNLSAHCSVNKAEICGVEGALAFICTSLTYKSQSRTLAIVENAGGILRNISSHIAVREDLRQVLRDHDTLRVILSQLRSPSLTVVSNACGTLWNLSARCVQDQQTLWDLGAVPMLRSLINSKHKMISMGSSAALKNLLQAKPEGAVFGDSKHGAGLPTLQARRQRALEQELDQSLAETCDNIESSPRASPTGDNGGFFADAVNGRPMFHSLDPRYGNAGIMTDSVQSNHSTQSDNTHDRMQHLLSRQHQTNGSCNGHRPADLALKNVNSHGDENGHVKPEGPGTGSERNNSVANGKGVLHPSDPLYNLYNKYVNPSRTSSRKESKHGKSQAMNDGKSSEDEERGGSSSSLVNGSRRPVVKVDNYVTDPAVHNENDDQPTDFSLRYPEEDDPNKNKPQKKVIRDGKSEDEEEEFLGAADSVQTYFTEGTPLNFSTATSLTDLREQPGVRDCRLGTQQEVHGEEEEVDKPEEEEDEGAEGGRLSRFSSLSSISSGEISAGHEEELEEDSDLQELVLAEGERVAAAAAKAAQEAVSPQHTATNASSHATDQHQQEQEWSAGATPLMFSRTTSLGSLSSFPAQQHQHLDDSGSVVSEFSRLASGAVSPSDLPDSPSQTMPPSPRQRARSQHDQHPPASSQLNSSLGVFNDSPRQFEEEGTPCLLSRGTSLSSLTLDDRTASSSQPPLATSRVRGDGKDSSTNTSSNNVSTNATNSPALARPNAVGAGRGRSFTPRTSSIPRPQSLGQDHERSRSSDPHSSLSPTGSDHSTTRGRTKEKRHSAVTETDSEKLLSACISSGMPNRRSSDAKTPVRSVSRSSSFVKSPRTPLGAPPIPIPPPPPPPRLGGSGDECWGVNRVSNIPINTVNLQVTTTTLNLNQQSEGVGGDTLHSYCTEDTPAALSQAGSVSDLSQVSLEQRSSSGGRRATVRRPLGPSHGLLLQGDSTDSSDAEGMLNRCIQAAMPKLKSIKGKPPSPRHNYGVPQPRTSHVNSRLPSGLPLSPSSSSSPGLPSALPRKSSTGASPQASPRHRPVPIARVSPALKLTPSERSVNASPSKPCTRNSDLKMNNFNSEEVKNWGAVEGTPLGYSNATSLSDLTVDSCEHEGHRKIQAGSSRIETVKRYATEGTPANFSRCESLSSLSCDDDGGQLTSRLAEAAQCHSNVTDVHTHPTTVESEEIPQRFNVEDTPGALSRRSSLSSIEGVACGASGAAKRAQQDANAPRNFGVEDTPVCFSLNSSLSSLSVESYPEETTPSEQALLQHCINQGMPRSEQRSSRGPVGRGGKRGKSGSRIPGLAHSPGRSPARSPGRSNIPGVPMQRLRLVPAPANTSRNNVAHANEAESSKLRTDLEQTEKSQLEVKSAGANVADEECSIIEDITEISEPISEAITAPIAEVMLKTSSSKSSPEDRMQSSSDDARVSPGRTNGSSYGVGSDVSMTDSMIVATEAIRVAQAVEVQAMEGRSSDDASVTSQTINSDGLLEDVVAPSAMESVLSLSTSLNDNNQSSQQRKVMECRHTRKIPTMVRRALGDHEMSDVNGTNGGSLASSCHSNLENVVPPAFMEADDMESSMISVASITSEVAEPRHSPPSLNSFIPSEAMAAIEAPAQQLAKLFSKEARQQMSSMTLTAGDDTSTCQEVTELDKDTLGPQDPATDTELAVDDIPQDIPDLPQDSPLHRARYSPQVTPSMLRKAVRNDRFRTFTKTDKPSAQVSNDDASKSGASSRGGPTPKERRSEQSERYRTRTLSNDDDIEMDSPTTPTIENPMGQPLQRRSSREKRQSNPARYQTRTIESADSTQHQEEGIVDFRDGAELDLTSEQLEALSQDANIVICTLNENREANTTDLLQGLSQENILDIETLSLISSDDDDNTFDVSAPTSPAVASRPRIVKPGEESAAETGDHAGPVGKGIRGKRKALYPGSGKALATIRPTQQQPEQAVGVPHTRAVPTSAAAFKPTPRTQGAVPQPKSIPQPHQNKQPSQQQSVAQPGSPKLPRATRASALRQKAGRVGSSSSSSPASSAGSSPRMGATPKTRQPPPQAHSPASGLKRQNTFTKEDQDETELPTKPTAATKPRYRRDIVQPSPAVSVRPMSRPSSHDGSMRADQPKSYSLTRDVRPPTANEMTEWNKDPKSGKPIKKDVTSRIANLWKKVEKAQATPKPKENDGKVWISKLKNKTPDLDSPPPLLRSSTYEKLTVGGDSRSDSERTDSGKTKTRLGLKLSRFRGRDSKSSPPSEASTPIDVSGASTPHGREAVTCDGKRKGSFAVMDGGEEACAVRTPQSAVVSPFHYHPPDSPSISVGIQRDSDEKGSPLLVSTRIPLPKSVVMSNNPRDDNGNAPYV
ncbi:Adenomatous polyposis coli protein repeat [Trinorchestia longiramus]|nr:Adenomatous polyposis coli protein repeat [Trinorchestia longiramus]